jgi:hypothetical protein
VRGTCDRAGVRAERDAGSRAGDGTVLWEEFVAIHRRRVLGVTDAETNSAE